MAGDGVCGNDVALFVDGYLHRNCYLGTSESGTVKESGARFNGLPEGL
jgi:hypothetical protein